MFVVTGELRGLGMKHQEEAEILANRNVQGGYFRLDLRTSHIAGEVTPGQFVHVRIPLLSQRILRRPFSVFDVDADSGRLSIIYKVVGEGPDQLSRGGVGTAVSVLGPLGRGFTLPGAAEPSLIVAGGYGCAATYLLAKRSSVRPCCLFGARSAADLLLVDEFRTLGCDVRIATDDGSSGHRGMVTELLSGLLPELSAGAWRIFACGPNPMLRAVSRIVVPAGLTAEISLDHAMCCGVGACFACVVKRRADNAEGWEYVRTCTDGPVFPAADAVWD